MGSELLCPSLSILGFGGDYRESKWNVVTGLLVSHKQVTHAMSKEATVGFSDANVPLDQSLLQGDPDFVSFVLRLDIFGF